VSESPTIGHDLGAAEPRKTGGLAAIVSRNIVASLARVVAVSLVALVLPAYLTHHLPVQTYAAWILILQLAAYVSYLDLGIQTGVSKFVAEYDARGDLDGAGRHASAGAALMMLTGMLGLMLSLVLAWQVPRLFATMPSHLFHEVRISLIFVGTSLSFGLVCSVCSAIFLGLQRYWIPMTINVINRALFAAIILSVVALHGNLAVMGVAAALVNVATGVLQVFAWRKQASHIRLSVRLVEYRVLKNVARFCTYQSIWTVGMLCVTGLDVTIVGHYDYIQTAYYSIATLPTSFVLLIVSSILNPLMPASSALSTQRSPAEMGDILARITRYGTMILLLTGLPLIVCGLPILRLWVGEAYALHTIQYLRILVLANVIRSLCQPYATMVSATGRQRAATAAAVCEAVVNLGSSIYLASRFGAIGVAFGTLLGSFVSVGLHFAITMHYTHSTLAISRSRLLLKGLVRPAVITLPSLAMIPLWWSSSVALGLPLAITWGLSTLLIAWFGSLNWDERLRLSDLGANFFGLRSKLNAGKVL